MRFLCLIIVFISWGGVLKAATLEEVEASLVNFEVLRGTYHQTRHVSGLSSPLESSGRLLLVRDSGLVWAQEEPFNSSYVFAEDVFRRSFSGQPEQLVKKKDNPQLFQFIGIFEAILSGEGKLLYKYFDLQFETINDDRWKVILVPKDKKLKRVFLSLQLQGKQFVEDVKIYEQRGNKTDIHFTNLSITPTVLSDEEKKYFHD